MYVNLTMSIWSGLARAPGEPEPQLPRIIMRSKDTRLPISDRPLPDGLTWLDEDAFLREAGAQSLKTESTYRSGLRLFADWLQHYRKAGYSNPTPGPLAPAV